MKIALLNRLLATSLIALSALGSAQAAPYSNLYIFGDSLSDTGNNFLLGAVDASQVITGNTYTPTKTYVVGGAPTYTYSSGPVWASSFAAGLGLTAAPSIAGGTNYAFGGAQTSLPGDESGGFPFSMTAQLGMFMAKTGATAAADALYVVAGGGNNARAAAATLLTTPLTLPQQISLISNTASAYATDIGKMVDDLQAAGAKNIIVWNTPNLGVTPFASAFGAQAQGMSALIGQTMNDALAYRLKGEVGVKTFDLFGLSSAIAANPGAFGLLNASDACGAASNNCDPATALFWDGIHPTTAAHQIIAGAMLTAAVPEPASYAMLALGLIAVGAVARRRRVS